MPAGVASPEGADPPAGGTTPAVGVVRPGGTEPPVVNGLMAAARVVDGPPPASVPGAAGTGVVRVAMIGVSAQT